MVSNVEDVDLAVLAAALRQAFEGSLPAGYVRGRTAIRDTVAAHLGCSQEEAENLVETMIGRGFLRYEGAPAKAAGGDGVWTIEASG